MSRSRFARTRRWLGAGLLAAGLASCDAAASPTPPAPTPASQAPATPTAPATAGGAASGSPAPAIAPAPGSDSIAFEPNPAAIVVVIDPGHGGCLDWGVPDPSGRGAEFAEKTITLAIAEQLNRLLLADGISAVMIREGDEALAGDDHPELGCHGPAWRDVDGDGRTGFEPTGRIRTRDELQARIDLANLVAADAFVSIHINSLTQDGVVFQIAATQTFYDDETPWGAASADLALSIQSNVVSAIDPLARHYDRQDRGTDAVAYFAISRRWSDDADSCEAPEDRWCKPHRALAMPGVLSEVGSINLPAEQELLLSPAGQEAVAEGLFDGLAAFLGRRPLAARIEPAASAPGERPSPVDGDGPPFQAAPLQGRAVVLRLTNTGNRTWPRSLRLVGGWEASDLPYLAAPPPKLERLEADVPPLAPGESVVLNVQLARPPAERAVAWISLRDGERLFSDLGSPALQLLRAP